MGAAVSAPYPLYLKFTESPSHQAESYTKILTDTLLTLEEERELSAFFWQLMAKRKGGLQAAKYVPPGPIPVTEELLETSHALYGVHWAPV